MESHFSKKKDLIYLNSGSHSITPKIVVQKIKDEIDTYELNPTARMFSAWGKLWEVQKKIAPHFGADPKNLFLRANVTQPLNEFILGVKLPAGCEILTSDQEYGAVYNMCRFRAERDSLGLKTFKMPSRNEIHQISTEELEARMINCMTAKTKLLVVSEIFTGNGLVLPLSRVTQEARKRGILTVIDAAHSPGYLKLDLENSGFDFYAGNLHKWWMGPKGTGFGWIKRESFKHLNPIQAGWISYELSEPFASFGDGDPQAIKTLMLGCQDFSPFFALPTALEFWNQHGTDRIQARKRELDRLLIKSMASQLGLFHHATQDPRMAGPLHAYLLPESFSKLEFTALIGRILEKTRVQVSVTKIDDELYLRLSPHIYNTEDEISLAVGRLKDFFSKHA